MSRDYIAESINRDDEDLKEYISELLNLNWIENETAAEGVAKKFINQGRSDLTTKQIDVLIDYAIIPHFHECEICGDATWNQMSFIEDNGKCSWCDNLMQD